MSYKYKPGDVVYYVGKRTPLRWSPVKHIRNWGPVNLPNSKAVGIVLEAIDRSKLWYGNIQFMSEEDDGYIVYWNNDIGEQAFYADELGIIK